MTSMHIYVWKYVCHISSACHAYVIDGVSPLPFFIRASNLNVVTTGNGTDTKNVLNGTVRLGLSLVSSPLSTALLL